MRVFVEQNGELFLAHHETIKEEEYERVSFGAGRYHERKLIPVVNPDDRNFEEQLWYCAISATGGNASEHRMHAVYAWDIGEAIEIVAGYARDKNHDGEFLDAEYVEELERDGFLEDTAFCTESGWIMREEMFCEEVPV